MASPNEAPGPYAYPAPIPGILTITAIRGRADNDPEYLLGGRLHDRKGSVIVRFCGAGGLCVSLHPEDFTARVRVSYAPRDALGNDPTDFALGEPLVTRSIMGEPPEVAYDQVMRSFRRLRRSGVGDGGILGAVRAEADRVGLRFAAVDGRAGGGHALHVARVDGWGAVLRLPGPGEDDVWELRRSGRRYRTMIGAGTLGGPVEDVAADVVGYVRSLVGDGVD